MLKTKCRETIIDGSMDDFSHDAAYAHALMDALNESPYMSDMLVTIKVRKRASEIMKSWGYQDGSG